MTLKYSQIIHHDLPSREKAIWYLCSLFLNEDPSFEVSVDGLLETTRYLRIKNLEPPATLPR